MSSREKANLACRPGPHRSSGSGGREGVSEEGRRDIRMGQDCSFQHGGHSHGHGQSQTDRIPPEKRAKLSRPLP